MDREVAPPTDPEDGDKGDSSTCSIMSMPAYEVPNEFLREFVSEHDEKSETPAPPREEESDADRRKLLNLLRKYVAKEKELLETNQTLKKHLKKSEMKKVEELFEFYFNFQISRTFSEEHNCEDKAEVINCERFIIPEEAGKKGAVLEEGVIVDVVTLNPDGEVTIRSDGVEHTIKKRRWEEQFRPMHIIHCCETFIDSFLKGTHTKSKWNIENLTKFLELHVKTHDAKKILSGQVLSNGELIKVLNELYEIFGYINRVSSYIIDDVRQATDILLQHLENTELCKTAKAAWRLEAHNYLKRTIVPLQEELLETTITEHIQSESEATREKRNTTLTYEGVVKKCREYQKKYLGNDFMKTHEYFGELATIAKKGVKWTPPRSGSPSYRTGEYWRRLVKINTKIRVAEDLDTALKKVNAGRYIKRSLFSTSPGEVRRKEQAITLPVKKERKRRKKNQ